MIPLRPIRSERGDDIRCDEGHGNEALDDDTEPLTEISGDTPRTDAIRALRIHRYKHGVWRYVCVCAVIATLVVVVGPALLAILPAALFTNQTATGFTSRTATEPSVAPFVFSSPSGQMDFDAARTLAPTASVFPSLANSSAAYQAGTAAPCNAMPHTKAAASAQSSLRRAHTPTPTRARTPAWTQPSTVTHRVATPRVAGRVCVRGGWKQRRVSSGLGRARDGHAAGLRELLKRGQRARPAVRLCVERVAPRLPPGLRRPSGQPHRSADGPVQRRPDRLQPLRDCPAVRRRRALASGTGGCAGRGRRCCCDGRPTRC